VKRMHPRDRLDKIIREANQLITDINSWNDNNPNEQPIDCEPERVVLDLASRCQQAWDFKDFERHGKLADELAEYVTRIRKLDN
jgi:hypothetical protein